MNIPFKLKTLSKVAKLLNANNITWAIGGTLLLYFKKKVDLFNDVDIMIAEEDSIKANQLLLELGEHQEEVPNPKYKTRNYNVYMVEGMQINLISGLVVVNDGKDYECPLIKENIKDYIKVKGEWIPLQSLKEWKEFYLLMGKPEKAALITD